MISNETLTAAFALRDSRLNRSIALRCEVLCTGTESRYGRLRREWADGRFNGPMGHRSAVYLAALRREDAEDAAHEGQAEEQRAERLASAYYGGAR